MAVSRQPKARTEVPAGQVYDRASQRSLVETLRVMDVAREVRKSRRPAEHARIDCEFRTELRENLLRTARQAGDPAEETDVEAAIDAYLTNRIVYTDPPWSFRLLLAHLWVRRRGLMFAALALAIALLIPWFLSFLFAAFV